MSIHQVATPLLRVHSHPPYSIKRKGTSSSMPDGQSRNENTSNPHTAHSSLFSSNPLSARPSSEQTISSTLTAGSPESSRPSRVHLFLNPPEAQHRSRTSPSSPRGGEEGGEVKVQPALSGQLPSLASLRHGQETSSPQDLSTRSHSLNQPYSQRREPAIARSSSFTSPGLKNQESSTSNPHSTSPNTSSVHQTSSWQEKHRPRYFQPLKDPGRFQSQTASANVSSETSLAGPSTTRDSSITTTQSFTPEFGQRPRVENIASISSSTKALIQAEQGALGIPVDIQAASRSADEKRRRNAGASARFRARRKEKEQANSRELDGLRQQIRDLTEDSDFYRGERDYFSSVVYQSPDRDRHFPRPPSPRHGRSSSGTAPNFSEASPTPAECYYQEQTSGDALSPESQQPRKRARGGEPASTSASSMSSPVGSHQTSSSYHLPSFAAPGERLPPIQGASSSFHLERQGQRYSTSTNILPPLFSDQFTPLNRSLDQGQQQRQQQQHRQHQHHHQQQQQQ